MYLNENNSRKAEMFIITERFRKYEEQNQNINNKMPIEILCFSTKGSFLRS